MTTMPNLLSSFVERFAREDETSANTRIGAIALRALTNKVPKIESQLSDGAKTPRIAPMIIPIVIRRIRLVEL